MSNYPHEYGVYISHYKFNNIAYDDDINLYAYLIENVGNTISLQFYNTPQI